MTNTVPSTPSLSLTKISPILVLIIILLAAIIFIAGIAHLLLRYLIKTPNIISPPISQTESSLHRQLRHLFRLHDTGLDQPSIDSLPLFPYKDIIAGPTQPFECAVCLSRFSPNDHLRLLPACTHAFHVSCIDVWLLSCATCPLCRRVVLVNDFFGHDDGSLENGEGRVLSIRLGNFERAEREVDERRCYSMGTVRYVENEGDLGVRLRGEDFEFQGNVIGRRRDKGESFSVSKIWLWSKNGRFPTCSDTDIHLPTPDHQCGVSGQRSLQIM